MTDKKLLPISIIILALCILLGLGWIGYSQQKSESKSVSLLESSALLNISQVAEYLGMTAEEVQGIINTEKNTLETSGIFTGTMFPYITINDKLYFSKEQIDEWIKDVSINHRQYDTKEGWIY